MAVIDVDKRRGGGRRGLVSVVGLLCVAASGCGGQNPVTGRVTRTDGSPVVDARVVFRSLDSGVTCTGVTNDDGYYELRRERPGNGAPAGTYQVVIAERLGSDPHDPETPGPPTIDWKYRRLETSGLQYAVEPGSNTFDIVVEPAQTKRHTNEKAAYPVGES